MKKNIFRMFDYVLIAAVIALIVMGIFFIYSSSVNSYGVSEKNEYIKQIIWASIGFSLMVFATIYDYRKLEPIAIWFYIALIAMLVYTLFLGTIHNNARSWIGIGDIGIQPSEFGKVLYILFLARYLNASQNENPLKRFIFAMGIMALPLMLILVQPDMGTASVYIPIFLIMCFVAGIPIQYILYVLFFGLLSIFIAILPIWNTEIAAHPLRIITILTETKFRILLIVICALISITGFVIRRYLKGPKYVYWITYVFSIITLSIVFSMLLLLVLKDYQIKRLIVFLNPDSDPYGAGWNINQSKIAIGGGGFSGQGYLNGPQSHFSFLPQRSTDFIFSILSEEMGFIGGLIVFGLYLFIFIKILIIIRKCPNKFGANIAAGILGMFTFHFFINVGMVMGIMPCTGIPLIFLSYGGSSLLSSMLCVGLLLSINARIKDLY